MMKKEVRSSVGTVGTNLGGEFMRKNTIIGIISAFVLSFVLLSSAIAAETAIIRVKDAITNNPIPGALVTVMRGRDVEEGGRNVLLQAPTNSDGEIRLSLSASEAATSDNIYFWAEKIGYVTYSISSGFLYRDGTLSNEIRLRPISAPTSQMLSGGTRRVLVKTKEFGSLREYQDAKAAGTLDRAKSVSGANVNVDLEEIGGSLLASPRHPDLTPRLGEDPRYFYGYSKASAPSDFWLDLPVASDRQTHVYINAYKLGCISTFGGFGMGGPASFYTPMPGESYFVYVPLIKMPAITLRRPLTPVTERTRAPIRVPTPSR